MTRISSEADLLAFFRPIDRDQVQIPAHFHFPMAVTDCRSWREPSGHRTYLVFEDPVTGSLRGVVFKRGSSSADGVAHMCEWCHSVSTGGAVGLLTAAAAPRRTVGLHLCRDLNCRENVLSPPNVHDLRESVEAHEKVQRVLKKMSDFVNASLR